MNERSCVYVLVDLLIVCCSVTIAEDIYCEFKSTELEDDIFVYNCDIKSINRNSANQNVINGTHLEAKSDIDVRAVGHSLKAPTNITMLDSIFCRQFTNLEEIYLDTIVVSLADENSLMDCKNLKAFTLIQAGVYGLSENFLPSPSKLVDLNLRSNKIIQLSKNFLEHQNDLKELNLGENQIETFDSNFFRPVGDLRLLALDRNKIKDLNTEWFENLQNLEDLSLELNRIAELPQNIFTPLMNLRKLWLFGNQLTIISSNSFGNHSKLHILSIFNNKINAIDKKLIANITKNTTVNELDMSGNVCSNESIKEKNLFNLKLKRCLLNFKWKVGFFKSSIRAKKPSSCGISKYTQKKIATGTFIESHSFPCHAALILKDGGIYFCAGTLVTERKVVTAANCIHRKSYINPLLPEEIIVILGAYNFTGQNETNRQLLSVSSIFIHKNWKPSSPPYDHDIAVIVLAQPIQISHSARPICKIPDKSSSILSLPEGIVVGYERNKNFSIPKVISIPIHTNADCHERFPILGSFLSPRMFCSGTGSGEGVCLGDSGGAVMVRHEGAFYLRGIVTSSINGGPSVCDAQTFSVFTDVIRYADWIDAIEE